MLHLEKINEKNVWDIIKLSVAESQKEFVAANDVSIIIHYNHGKWLCLSVRDI